VKSQKEILRWLKANGLPLGGLTSHDVYALVTSVGLCNLISYESAPPELFEAYSAIVRQMQPSQRHLAFHAIACELDWSHRRMIWTTSGLSADADGGIPTSRCAAERGQS
jgi:hypothetical protein